MKFYLLSGDDLKQVNAGLYSIFSNKLPAYDFRRKFSACGNFVEGKVYEIDGAEYLFYNGDFEPDFAACDISGDFYPIKELQYIDREDIYVCESKLSRYFSWSSYHGEYIRDEDAVQALYRGGTVVTYYNDDDFVETADTGNRVHIDDVFCQDGDFYEHEPETKKRFGYKEKPRKKPEFTKNGQAAFGFEIEKEDADFLENNEPHEIFDEYGISIEKDGSLDDDSGFEAVFPPLFMSDLNRFNGGIYKEIACADFSKACGGHIHFSKNGEIFENLVQRTVQVLPFIHALYTDRVNNTYAEYRISTDKYSAAHLLSDRIEFRFFPAVKSEKSVIFRATALNILFDMKRPVESVLSDFFRYSEKKIGISGKTIKNRVTVKGMNLISYYGIEFNNNLLEV